MLLGQGYRRDVISDLKDGWNVVRLRLPWFKLLIVEWDFGEITVSQWRNNENGFLGFIPVRTALARQKHTLSGTKHTLITCERWPWDEININPFSGAQWRPTQHSMALTAGKAWCIYTSFLPGYGAMWSSPGMCNTPTQTAQRNKEI